MPGMTQRRLTPLVRPTPHPDEWHLSLGIRTAQLNGLRLRSAPTYRGMASELIAHVGPSLTQHFAETNVEGQALYAGHLVPDRRLLWSWGHTRVCIACLRESPHIRMLWRFRTLDTCWRHGLSLTHRCPACNGVLDWAGRAGSCSCGWDATRDQPQSPESLEVSEVSKIAMTNWRRVGVAGATVSAESLAIAVSTWELVLCLARQLRGRDGVARNMENTERIGAWLMQRQLKMPEHPDEVEDFLRRLKEPILLTAALRYFLKLRSTPKLEDSVFSALPLAHWCNVLKSLGAHEATCRFIGMPRVLAAQKGLVSVYQLGLELGQTSKRTDAILSSLGIIPIEVQSGNASGRYIDQISVRAIKQAVAQGQFPRTSPRRIHVPLFLTETRRRLSRWAREKSPSYVESLFEDIARQARCSPPPPSAVELGSKSFWHRHKTSAVEAVLIDLASNRIGVYRNPTKEGLQHLLVAPQVLAALKERSMEHFKKTRRAQPGQLELFHEPG